MYPTTTKHILFEVHMEHSSKSISQATKQVSKSFKGVESYRVCSLTIFY